MPKYTFEIFPSSKESSNFQSIFFFFFWENKDLIYKKKTDKNLKGNHETF